KGFQVPPVSLAAASTEIDPTDDAAADQEPEVLRGEDETGEASPAAPGEAQAEAITSGQEPESPAEAPATQPAVDPVQAAIAKIKRPVPWFSWGADYRIRNEYLHSAFNLNKKSPLGEVDWLRHRLRAWSTISLGDFLDVNTRIVWESRNFFKPEFAQPFDDGEVLFDLLNATLKNPFDLPIVIVGGRQEIALGDRWLVFEGTPLDGSRTIYFDAIRLTTTLAEIQTKIDTIYIEQDAEAENWVRMIKTRNENLITGVPEQRYVTEQDERGAIVWVENKSLRATEIDGYFIYKNDDREAPGGLNAEFYTFGTRALHDLNEHWKIKGEIAAQFGHRMGRNVCGLASLDRLAYHFNDAHKNWLRLDYEYMSGDRPGTGEYEGFDPLWGRWPRFSELLIYTASSESRISDLSNLHRVALGHSVSILPQMEMLTDYHLLFADQNTFRDRPGFSDSGCFRGQLLTWWLKYVITPQISGHVVAEFFCPGDYYAKSNNDPAVFVRTELVFSF
ncbi:MAG TPA: alginate export family protein, partial [Phycisphaerae bacterium]|nr:alginate export family protein [Phycisphaerae bacterium]